MLGACRLRSNHAPDASTLIRTVQQLIDSAIVPDKKAYLRTGPFHRRSPNFLKLRPTPNVSSGFEYKRCAP